MFTQQHTCSNRVISAALSLGNASRHFEKITSASHFCSKVAEKSWTAKLYVVCHGARGCFATHGQVRVSEHGTTLQRKHTQHKETRCTNSRTLERTRTASTVCTGGDAPISAEARNKVQLTSGAYFAFVNGVCRRGGRRASHGEGNSQNKDGEA